MAPLDLLDWEPVLPQEPCATEAVDPGTGLVETLLKDPGRTEGLIRNRRLLPGLVPRLLGIALAGFTVFGGALATILISAGADLRLVPMVRAGDLSPAALVLAYDIGLIAAIGVCLPSFYFYSLLAGVRPTVLEVAAHALKSLTVTSIALIGILPVYFAVVLGMVVFHAPREILEPSLYAGLALPFLAGLWGLRSLRAGFLTLCDTMPPAIREKRTCFLRRFLLAWSAVYTAVWPVMIHTLWEAFG